MTINTGNNIANNTANNAANNTGRGIIIFTGPTLSPREAKPLLAADYRPPARQGDVYRACLDQPKVIAIIDGYFESVPAVWHKEILYAMAQGIHVFGCASMGALRAAELAYYGMQGIGQIYQQFASGELEDDDEVAIIHAPEPLNYQPISEAMVNIRATLQGAETAGIITRTELTALIAAAKNRWYPDRCFANLLSDAAHWLDQSSHQKLSQFITEQPINLKRNDALALIEHLNQHHNDLPVKTVNYPFVHTDAWQQLIDQVNKQHFAANVDINLDDLYTELKLQGRFESLRAQAQARQIALEKAQKHQATVTPAQLQTALLLFSEQQQCIENGQINFDKLSQWFSSQKLTMSSFDQLMRKQAMLNWVEAFYANVDEQIVDILRLNNEFGLYRQRIMAKNKTQQQQAATPEDQRPTELTPPDDVIWSWYFQAYLKRPIPTDLVSFAQSAGFSDVDTFHQAVIAEYQYTQLNP